MREKMLEKMAQLETSLNDMKVIMKERMELHDMDISEFEYDKIIHDKIRDQLWNDLELFYDSDVPKLQAIIADGLKEIKTITATDLKVAGKPNPNFLNLIKQGLIAISTPIFGTHKGITQTGYLTKEGYFYVGNGKYNSLRKAAYYSWEPNREIYNKSFWMVNTTPLQEYIDKIKL